MVNKMRYIIVLVVMVFAACGPRKQVVAAAQGQVVELSDSIIEHRAADTVDFGRVRRGEVVEKELMVRNVGDIALVITQLDLSCGCVQADYPRNPLMPAQEGALTLALDTHDLSGWVFKTIGMRTTQGIYTLCVTAEITN